jgi:hypothetical protein
MDDQEAVNNQNGGPRKPDHVIHGNRVKGEIKAFEPVWGNPYWVYVVYVTIEQTDEHPVQGLDPEVVKIIRKSEDWIKEHVSRHGGRWGCRLFLCWG